jgi:hypothetical protein
MYSKASFQIRYAEVRIVPTKAAAHRMKSPGRRKPFQKLTNKDRDGVRITLPIRRATSGIAKRFAAPV